MIVRDATIQDLPAIVDIYNHAILTGVATFDLEPHTVDQRLEWFERFGDEFPLLVCEAPEEYRITGFAYYLPYRSKAGYRFTRETTIYVDPSRRRGGVATLLYEQLISRARASGVHVLVAVLGGRNEASVALHRKFGFELVGVQREVGYKFNQWIDASIYQINL